MSFPCPECNARLKCLDSRYLSERAVQRRRYRCLECSFGTVTEEQLDRSEPEFKAKLQRALLLAVHDIFEKVL